MNTVRTQALSGTTVLITRPAKYATYLSDEIAALGGKPIVFPTLETIIQTDGLDVATLTRHDIAIFISRSAVAAVAEFIEGAGIQWPKSLRCAAVGNKTAQALRAALGVETIIVPDKDYGIEALMAMQTMQALTGQRVVFFDGGGSRSALLVDKLQARGCSVVTHVIVYERINPLANTSELVHALQQDGVDYVILTSLAAAANLIEMLNQECIRILKAACMIVYSERIAMELARQCFRQIVVSRSASDDAVIEAILLNQSDPSPKRPESSYGYGIDTMDVPD